jgi:hypothetical protein
MLTIVNASKVVSDQLFEMEITGAGHDGFVVKYVEPGKTLYLNAFFPGPLPRDPVLLARVPMVVEIPRQLDWSSPKGVVLSDAEQTRVLSNLRAALEAVQDPFKFQFEGESR